MAYRNDASPYSSQWTNAKLLRRAREISSLERFSPSFIGRAPITLSSAEEVQKFLIEETRNYRESWLNPVLNEIEKRLVKTKKVKP